MAAYLCRLGAAAALAVLRDAIHECPSCMTRFFHTRGFATRLPVRKQYALHKVERGDTLHTHHRFFYTETSVIRSMATECVMGAGWTT